jgi:hypothetical protein
MKCIIGLLLLVSAGGAMGQESSPPARSNWVGASLGKGTWDFGVVASGGTGLGYATDTHFTSTGARLGLILTRDHGTGWKRGNLEWNLEMLPLYVVFTPKGAVYGGSLKPMGWRWNFTSGKTIAPYASLSGGILFSTRNLPPGNTSWVNFTPQVAMGADIFFNRGRALVVEGAYVHHSNAGLATFNPGYNAALFFTIGYAWFRSSK